MIVSLSELAEMAKKATSGCGHPFGIAEEMAYATRWLCEHGLPGIEVIIEALEQPPSCAPGLERNAQGLCITHPTAAPISALTLGPSIADLLITYGAGGKVLSINTCTQPLILIPFIVKAAKTTTVHTHWTTDNNTQVTVSCGPGCDPGCDTEGTHIFAHDTQALRQTHANNITCQWGQTAPVTPRLLSPQQLREQRQSAIANGCEIDDLLWKKVQQHAHNTYVPVSETSRLRGAGAGLTDND